MSQRPIKTKQGISPIEDLRTMIMETQFRIRAMMRSGMPDAVLKQLRITTRLTERCLFLVTNRNLYELDLENAEGTQLISEILYGYDPSVVTAPTPSSYGGGASSTIGATGRLSSESPSFMSRAHSFHKKNPIDEESEEDDVDDDRDANGDGRVASGGESQQPDDPLCENFSPRTPTGTDEELTARAYRQNMSENEPPSRRSIEVQGLPHHEIGRGSDSSQLLTPGIPPLCPFPQPQRLELHEFRMREQKSDPMSPNNMLSNTDSQLLRGQVVQEVPSPRQSQALDDLSGNTVAPGERGVGSDLFAAGGGGGTGVDGIGLSSLQSPSLARHRKGARGESQRSSILNRSANSMEFALMRDCLVRVQFMATVKLRSSVVAKHQQQLPLNGSANSVPALVHSPKPVSLGMSQNSPAQSYWGASEWAFNVFEFFAATRHQSPPLVIVGNTLLRRHFPKAPRGLQVLSTADDALQSFLTDVDSLYGDVHYHNNLHAAQVAHTMAWLSDIIFGPSLSDVDRIISIVSALCHDIGHRGRNNAFYVNTMDPVALIYNDVSVLENYHASLTFDVLSKPGNDIFCDFTPEEYRQIRQMVIELILATDLKLHMDRLAMFTSRRHNAQFAPLDYTKDKWLSLKICMVACDLSHATLEWELHLEWCERLNEEFFLQGDAEAQLGLPKSPLCDRASYSPQAFAGSQVGFLDVVVRPIFVALQGVGCENGQVGESCLRGIDENRTLWKVRSRTRSKRLQTYANCQQLPPLANMGSFGNGSAVPFSPRHRTRSKTARTDMLAVTAAAVRRKQTSGKRNSIC